MTGLESYGKAVLEVSKKLGIDSLSGKGNSNYSPTSGNLMEAFDFIYSKGRKAVCDSCEEERMKFVRYSGSGDIGGLFKKIGFNSLTGCPLSEVNYEIPLAEDVFSLVKAMFDRGFCAEYERVN